MTRFLLIYNPAAGGGRARRWLPKIREDLAGRGIEIDLHLTAGPGDGETRVQRADFGAYDGVIAGGGDGTCFEVVNGCFRNPAGPTIPLGVLPVGTGNSFARDLDLATGKVESAVERLALGRTRKVDVGHCRTDGGEYHFLNILGLGFVSDVTAAASRLKILGSAAYTAGVVYRTLRLSAFDLSLEVDGRPVEDRKATFVEISNSRYTADFLMAPDASIDDGLLDVTVLGSISRRRLLRLFPTVFRGEHLRYPEVETFKVRSIRVESVTPKLLTPDGEMIGQTPAVVTCLHRALEVLA